MSDFYKKFGRLIKEKRLKRFPTQKDLAMITGYTRAGIANIEVGRSRLPLHKALELKKILGFTCKEMVGLCDDCLHAHQMGKD